MAVKDRVNRALIFSEANWFIECGAKLEDIYGDTSDSR